MCLLLGIMVIQLPAQAEVSETGGELLYSTYCIACHNKSIHWREKKLAADWPSLKAEVERWQNNLGLGWHENEILAVSAYLNAVYYHFPVTEKKDVSGREP